MIPRVFRQSQRQVGFTLIELLVVIVILSCLLSLAVLAGGNNRQREVYDEAQRLEGIIALLADEAVLDNREYGLLFSAKDYRVVAYEENCACWAARVGERSHSLPEGLRLELMQEGEPLQLVAAELKDPESKVNQAEPQGEFQQPQLLLLSSGELSPFRLRVKGRDTSVSAYELGSDGFQLPNAVLVED